MNSSRYILARIAMSFGLFNKNKRLSEAADELHLLRQAEEILGADVWPQVEEIEEISVDYWTLRKDQLEIDKLEEQINQADNILDASEEERNAILNHSSTVAQAIEKSRNNLVKELEKLTVQRDHILTSAQQVKRRFEASRTKVSVLSTQDTDSQSNENQTTINEERAKLAGYKEELAELKNERDQVVTQISDINIKISNIETELSTDRKRLRDEASSAYQNMGKANRDKSKLHAEAGLIEEHMKEHYSTIGRYISMNAGTDPICAQLCKENSHLVAQMQSLRSSIALNHKLAAIADS